MVTKSKRFKYSIYVIDNELVECRHGLVFIIH